MIAQDLNSFLNSLTGSEDSKLFTIQSFLENSNNKVDADGLAKILTAVNIASEIGKLSIIQSFLKNPNNENNKLTVEKFIEFLQEANITIS